MRLHLAVTMLLAACLVASVAQAAPDKVEVTFESLAASGVTGTATIDPAPGGEVRIHANLKGLEPNTVYEALLFDQSLTCGTGTPSVVIIQFEANPAGVAVWNEKLFREISTMQSIGIREVDTNLSVACGSVPQ